LALAFAASPADAVLGHRERTKEEKHRGKDSVNRGGLGEAHLFEGVCLVLFSLSKSNPIGGGRGIFILMQALRSR
jgi:hypothetical protein